MAQTVANLFPMKIGYPNGVLYGFTGKKPRAGLVVLGGPSRTEKIVHRFKIRGKDDKIVVTPVTRGIDRATYRAAMATVRREQAGRWGGRRRFPPYDQKPAPFVGRGIAE